MTLSSGLLACPWTVAGHWQLNCSISRATVAAKGFRKFAAYQFFGLHSWQVRQDFISNRNS